VLKFPINPIINPNPVYSHSTCENIKSGILRIAAEINRVTCELIYEINKEPVN
jgi:hypothetical protein